MKINKKFIVIVFIGLFIYYLVPYLAMDMSEGDANNYAALCILFINSIYIITSSVILTKNSKFKWYYLLTVILLFVPSVFMYFNNMTIIYILLYTIEYLFTSNLCMKYFNK